MNIYCKNCRNTQVTCFQKNYCRFKKKSKRAICLTERTFIHEIEDKYDPESNARVYPKFFND